MAIDTNLPPPSEKPAVRMQTRTQQLHISTPRPGSGHYSFSASRERIFFDEDGAVVNPTQGVPSDYTFFVDITPEFLAANPELAPLIRGISQFIDKVDPGPTVSRI